MTCSSWEPGRARSSRLRTIWSQTWNRTSRQPFTKSHSRQSANVQTKGTPFRKPRKSGGSPSGVSSPPQFDTMKMKKITMCCLRWRDSFARSSGRTSSTEAPVVPMKLASPPPSAMTAVFTSGVPASEPRSRMPPVITNREPSRTMNDVNSSSLSQSSWRPAPPYTSGR
jgi:hypothetical protein